MRSIAIAILFVLALAPPVLADLHDGINVISINDLWNSTAYDWNCRRLRENQIVTYTLWLHDPINPDFEGGQEQAVTAVGGFECRLAPTEGVTILGWHFPVPSINLGEGNNLVVGYSQPVPVVYGRAVLATFDVFLGNTSFELPEDPAYRCLHQANAWITIHPAWRPSIPGMAVYLDMNDSQDNLVPAWTASEYPDFEFAILREKPVGSEGHTWGALKSLYR